MAEQKTEGGPVRKRVETRIGLKRTKADRATAVVTVRMPRRLHERIRALRWAERLSMNQLCVAALEAALEELEADPPPECAAHRPDYQHFSPVPR